jgi:putative oxidoreductase
MKFVSLLGRVLFALIFVIAAPRHFSHEGIQDAAKHGVAPAALLVPLSGVLALIGAISVILGYKARWGAWALVGFLIPVTFLMHSYWTLSDPIAIHVQIAMFFKNLSMLGAALVFSQTGAGSISIDELHSRSRALTNSPQR